MLSRASMSAAGHETIMLQQQHTSPASVPTRAPAPAPGYRPRKPAASPTTTSSSSSSPTQIRRPAAANPEPPRARPKRNPSPPTNYQRSDDEEEEDVVDDDDEAPEAQDAPGRTPKGRARARNRQAAHKFRIRKRHSVERLKEAEAAARETHARLKHEAARLRSETLRLRSVILEHGECACPYIDEYIQASARTCVATHSAGGSVRAGSISSSSPV